MFLWTSSDVTFKMCRVGDLPVEFFDSLEDGDLLFIDSSHAIRPGGDVIHLYREVLPRLRSDVLIHIHDIFFPFTYQAIRIGEPIHRSETCLLQTLLVNNSSLRILGKLATNDPECPLGAVDGSCCPRSPQRCPTSTVSAINRWASPESARDCSVS